VDTSISHSDWQAVYYAGRMAIFFVSSANIVAFRSAHILLHVNVRNDDVVTGKNLITLLSLKVMKCPLALLCDYEHVISV